MKAPSFEYELYYPNKTHNLEKLNLSYCKGIKINIEIFPINITEDIYKYNSSSGYYNNICYTADSKEGTDITLTDRKEEFFDNNMSICEFNCDFIAYNYETKKAVCSCNIKTEIPFMNDIKFDKEVLMNSFTDINNFANLKMMKCYKIVFRKNALIKNIGFFFYNSLIALNLICLILFLFNDFDKLRKEIEKINIKNLDDINKGNDINIFDKNKRENINSVIRNQIKNKKDKSNQRKIRIKNNKIIQGKNQNLKKNKSMNSNKHSPIKKSKTILLKDNNINDNNKNIRKKSLIEIKNNNDDNKKIGNDKNKRNSSYLAILNNNNKNSNKKKKHVKKKSKINLNYSELNSLLFQEALALDKRTYLQYYFSLLKTKHIILFIFYNEDYNCRIIKISLFILNFAIHMAVNALFFSDATMHKIYIDHGSYNFVYQLPIMVYSSLISAILSILIKFLGLSESAILKLKKEKENTIINFKKLINKLKIKFTIFFVSSFSILALFCYYISCFCGIYKNTQMHLIEDSLFSFSLSLVTPFAIYLLPGIFRKIGIKEKNKYFYGFSKVLQIL